jgi:electron transfer flavoprotein beta subunit
MPEGTEIVEAPMPALVTVSNELGQPRYPTLRGIMTATRKQPVVWSLEELGFDAGDLLPQVETVDLYVPVTEADCEFIEGEDDADAGRLLALKLREAKLV